MSHTHNYADELLINVNAVDGDVVIDALCRTIYKDNISNSNTDSEDYESSEDEDVVQNEMRYLVKLLKRLPKPYTIIQEPYHIDSSYRDTYYTYYSNQHFHIKRYSRRLSFFSSTISQDDFFNSDDELKNEISKSFMGACVINPISGGLIGRTLIDPRYILDLPSEEIYMRLSRFKLNIYGKELFVNAFPYRMQDERTMRCAEITLLNLLEYYSNSYADYKSIVPSEILESEQKNSYERVLPSLGTSYPILTKAMSDFGFAPRLYNLYSMEKNDLSLISQKDELKRIMHYYIESGIPVAVNLSPIGNNGTGHSIICIGHADSNEECLKKAKKNKWLPFANKENCHPLINSADFFDTYVVIDDNEPVYQVRSFDNLSLYPDMKVENIAVPLYKRMFLDATDAAATIKTILNHDKLGINEWSKDYFECGNTQDIIMRMFMASSRSFKEYRLSTLTDTTAKKVYAMIPMPRFVWVCELYTEKDYSNKNVFGEIIIDATSANGIGYSARGLILTHYPNMIGFRYPDHKKQDFQKVVMLDNDTCFKGYSKNLMKIETL